MDHVRIEKLEVFAHHGVYAEEKKMGAKFVVTADLELSLEAAGKSDVVTDTVHYGEAARLITIVMQERNHDLIESAAEDAATALLLKWQQVSAITLTIEKPWAPVGLPLQTVSVTIRREWNTVYLGLGSNIGDRRGYLEFAKECLRERADTKIIAVSKTIETEPWGYTDQDRFMNNVIAVRTILSPEELLDVLQKIELDAYRERKIHWGPRTLDIDILFYGDRIIGTERLVVPHPYIEERTFVLEPLCEIAPWLRHPVTKKTCAQMLAACREEKE